MHRLAIPALLRKALHSTRFIESLFSTVRHCEGNIKRYLGSGMMRRLIASVLLHAEKNLSKIKGYEAIEQVLDNIKKLQQEDTTFKQVKKIA